MGFNSLKRVEGPGQIILTYEEEQKGYYYYRNWFPPEGVQCFSKKEMLFLARHPQFNGKMYQPCELDDPCFSLDHHKRRIGRNSQDKEQLYWYYNIADIPENCSTFVGVICINELFGKFANMTQLIGQLHVMGALFDRLDTVFPKLEGIYPYELPNIGLPSFYKENKYTCNQMTVPDLQDGNYAATKRDEALQVVRVRLNRFLKNMSLPLRPIRPIDISTPYIGYTIPEEWYFYANFLPETIANPCEDFPQFDPKNCGRFIYNGSYPIESDTSTPDPYSGIICSCSFVLVAVGVLFSLRAIALLMLSNLRICLPYSRIFIAYSLFISTLATLEGCLLYQKFYDIIDFDRSLRQILAEFDSPHLAAPLAQFTMLVIVSSKHVCLSLLIFCHIDLAVFYRTKNLIISRCFCILAAVLAVIMGIYLRSQLTVCIRGRKPNLSMVPRHVIYMPFIMNIASEVNFSLIIPPTKYLLSDFQIIYFTTGEVWADSVVDINLSTISLELHGRTFPEIVKICDILLIVVTIFFRILISRDFIQPHNNFTVLFILYIQLSVNRLRYYIYEILVNDYCLRREKLNDADVLHEFSCYWPYRNVQTNGIIMDEYLWRIVEKVLEKLPYLSFLIVSWYSWKFARFQSHLGAALRIREIRLEKQNTISDNLLDNDAYTLSTSLKKDSRGTEERGDHQTSNSSTNTPSFSSHNETK